MLEKRLPKVAKRFTMLEERRLPKVEKRLTMLEKRLPKVVRRRGAYPGGSVFNTVHASSKWSLQDLS